VGIPCGAFASNALQLILQTQPDVVFLELCRERAPLLLASSEDLIKSYDKPVTMKEIQAVLKTGWSGLLQLVLAHVFRKVRQGFFRDLI
jgi:pheromone shutdown protein TraB